jgi:hypothetical protein
MSDNGPVASSPIASLTPEESARKFDIMDGINAIPVHDMPMRLKPLAQRLMSHSSYGQAASYASYASLAKETGTIRQRARKQLAELIAGGWFLTAGRRGSSKYARANTVPGTRMVEYLRQYFACIDQKKQKRKAAPTGGSPTTLKQPNEAAPTGGTNPVQGTIPKNRLKSHASGGPRGGRPQGPSPRPPGKREAPPTPQYRDLAKIDCDDWTVDEREIIEMANAFDHDQPDGIARDLEEQLTHRWPKAMEAAKGNYKLIGEVIRGMWDHQENAKPGKEIRSPFTYLAHVLRDRAKSAAIKPKTVKPSPAVADPAPAPVGLTKTQAMDEGKVRSGINESAKEYRTVGHDWVEILNLIDRAMRQTGINLRLNPDEIAKRYEWLRSELNHPIKLENPEDDEDSAVIEPEVDA